jgi:nicotinate-nucleotide adenylyltransferase
MSDGSEPRQGLGAGKRVGVVGGTFDPIHVGHLAMAEAAADCADLDEVILLPASVPPHRPAAHADAGDRLEMSRLAVRGHPRIHVSDLELRRSGRSYTVDTLEALSRERPRDQLFLVLGWDAARDLGTWREPERVLDLARLVVVTRPGWPRPLPADLIAAGLEPAKTVLCHADTPDVGASEIRRRVDSGSRLDGLLDPAVEDYIRAHHLYSTAPGPSGHNR